MQNTKIQNKSSSELRMDQMVIPLTIVFSLYSKYITTALLIQDFQKAVFFTFFSIEKYHHLI